MKILIADDSKDTVAAFSRAIERTGHTAISCTRLRDAIAVIENPNQKVDILFLDNHFPEEEHGFEKIREFQRIDPNMDIVVTTKQVVQPQLVADIVELGVGFFKKNTVDSTLLEAEICQRVNARKSKEEVLKQKLQQLHSSLEYNQEGVFRLLKFLTKQGKKRAVSIKEIRKTGRFVIMPRFEKVFTVHVGAPLEISEEHEFEQTLELKASTKLEIGLGINESVNFFGSKIGGEIKKKLEAEFSIATTQKIRSAYKRGQKMSLSQAEESRGIRRREYYRGVKHEIYETEMSSSCAHCAATENIVINVYTPIEIVEVSAAFDKKGYLITGEDGRQAHIELS